MFRGKNIWLCMAGSSLLLAFITITMGFLPKFFRGCSRARTRVNVGIDERVLGIAGAILAFKLRALGWTGSKLAGHDTGVRTRGDRSSIRHVLFGTAGLGGRSFCFLAGLPRESLLCSLPSCGPRESVAKEFLSTVIGLKVAVGTLIGGVGGPALAGWAADQWGLHASLDIDVACAALACLAALFIRETAPRTRVLES